VSVVPSGHSPSRSSRAFGPVRVIGASIAFQLLGLVLAAIGVSILGWVLETAAAGTGGLGTVLTHATLGTVVVCNGLYLSVVRFR